VVSHLAQDHELVVVEAGDRRPGTDVGWLLGEHAFALTAAGINDS